VKEKKQPICVSERKCEVRVPRSTTSRPRAHHRLRVQRAPPHIPKMPAGLGQKSIRARCTLNHQTGGGRGEQTRQVSSSADILSRRTNPKGGDNAGKTTVVMVNCALKKRQRAIYVSHRRGVLKTPLGTRHPPGLDNLKPHGTQLARCRLNGPRGTRFEHKKGGLRWTKNFPKNAGLRSLERDHKIQGNLGKCKLRSAGNGAMGDLTGACRAVANDNFALGWGQGK